MVLVQISSCNNLYYFKMFKLALIIYRKLILCRLAMGSNNLQHKEPIMEYILLFFITLGIDFIIVVWVE